MTMVRGEGMEVILKMVGEALRKGCLGASEWPKVHRRRLDGWAEIGGIVARTCIGGC